MCAFKKNHKVHFPINNTIASHKLGEFYHGNIYMMNVETIKKAK